MHAPSNTRAARPRVASAARRLLTLLLLLAATAVATVAQSFSLPIPRDVGPNPNSAAAGDFNGDGKTDLAVGLTQGASVSVMLGRGDGTFVSSITYNTDQNPQGTVAGDFNKDGKLDVAVGNFFGGPTSSGNVSVLLGNGDGTFQPAVNYGAGSPADLTAVDLNSDGNLDLVMASYLTNKVTVLLGRGDGTFQAATAYSVGASPEVVAVADFDRDGKLDLAVSDFMSAEVSLLKGNGDGTFQPAVSLPIPSGGPTGITSGDLNADGKQDLAVVSPNASVVSVLLGKGDGTFQAPVTYSIGNNTGSPKIADFNGDGKPDLAVAADAGAVVVCRGNGDGTLQTAQSYPTQRSAAALVVADFNNDGRPDLAVTNNGIGRINILLNSPSLRGVAVSATAGAQASGVTVASLTDFDATKTPASFTTTINWGDGTSPTAGTVSAVAGGFSVGGTHTYAREGTYSVAVHLADDSGNFADATATATVADAPLAATGKTIDVLRGAPFTAVVANFRDGDPSGQLSDFTATINWGDGASSSGQIAADGVGGFNVSGGHTYASAGAFPVGVSIRDVGGSTASASGTSNVTAIKISGRTLKADGTPLAGVSVTLSGAESASVTTVADGGYSFDVVPGNTYTVTPSRQNYTFSPTSKSFANVSGNQTFDFAATLNSYTISGRVLAAGSPLAGATVTLGGGATNTQTTDSSGGYSFTVPAEGDYTITVSRQNYTFETVSKTFSNLSSSQTFDFSAAINRYSVSGRVADAGGAPLSGATVNLSGAQSGSTTTDANGNYSFANLAAEADYTITPSKAFYTFSPASRTFAGLAADQSAANFTATLSRYTVSGRVTLAGAPLSGVAVAMSGGASGVTNTDAQGNYSFASVPAGASVTLTPSLANYTFAPQQQSINIDGDRPGIDFVASPLPAVLQFSQAQYQVAEDGARVTITVTRAGNTSGTTSVNVATVDDPSPVRCDDTTTKPGVAFARCDYSTTVTTLTFNPGESIKTFTVPIIDDAFVEPAETFSVRLSEPSAGASLGAQATAAVVIADNDAPGKTNPIFSTDFFVRQQYLDFLSREPEAGQPWSSVLNNCAPNDQTCDRVSVSANFFRSQEFQLKGLFVFRFYKVAFARLPHYDEIVADMSSVTGSTTAELVAKKAAYTAAFAQRQGFKTLYDPMTSQQFVDALMGRYGLPSVTTISPSSPDDASAPRVTLTRSDLVNGLNAGALTRGQVVRAVADSDEVSKAEFNPAFVAMQYFGYLRRDPEDDGYANWLRTINANPGDVRSMVNGFVNSTEYKLRFGQP